jgi:hypothetical protein
MKGNWHGVSVLPRAGEVLETRLRKLGARRVNGEKITPAKPGGELPLNPWNWILRQDYQD